MAAVAAIDFSALVERENARFVGREWVLEEIDRWVRDLTGPRYFLITGHPGSGKTALSARLAALFTGPAGGEEGGCQPLGYRLLSAFHFCNAREALWNNPLSFCKSIASQMASRYPEYASALRNTGTGEVRIDIRQEVAGGSAVGVGALSLNLGQLSSEQAFLRLCREPLQHLAIVQPDRQFLILIDGIDEALDYRGDVDIAALLAQLSELPRNVRLILTSREKPDVELMFGGAALQLSSPDHIDRNRRDLAAYIDAAAPPSGTSPDGLARLKQALLAQGNFLYAYLAIRMWQTVGFDDVTIPLPSGLPDLIAEWITRLLKFTGRDWIADYAPILGTLSVARQRITETQLKTITGWDGARLRNNLIDLREFLIAQTGANSRFTYSLYHDCLREFLFLDTISLKASQLQNRFHLAETDQHERIVAAYRGRAISWAQPEWDRFDDYAFRHLASHLSSLASEPSYRQALFQFISPALLRKKRRRFNSDDSFVDDVHQAIRTARARQPAAVEEWLRGLVIIGCAQQPFGYLPSLAVGALAIAGDTVLATSLATLRGQISDYLYIAEAAVAQQQRELARQALDRAMTLERDGAGSVPVRRVLDLLYALGDEGGWRRAMREMLSKHRIMGAIGFDTFREIAEFCVRIGDLSEIEAAIKSIPSDRAFKGPAPPDFYGYLSATFQAMHTAQLAEALYQAGQPDEALTALDRSLDIERSTGRPMDDVRITVALLLLRLDRPLRAQRLIASLRAKSRAKFQARRRAAFGAPQAMFEQARKTRDDDLFQSAVARALDLGMLDLAIGEAENRNDDAGRGAAFSKIAIAAARCGRWREAARSLDHVGIVTNDELWLAIARSIGGATEEEFGVALDLLDAAAARLENLHNAAQIRAVCAYGMAQRGDFTAARTRVVELIADEQERAGRQRLLTTISRIAIWLDEEELPEARRIAEALLAEPALQSANKPISLLGENVSDTLARMRQQFQDSSFKSAQVSELAKQRLDKMFGSLEPKTGESEAPQSKDEAAPVASAAFLAAIEEAKSPLDALGILKSSGADAVIALGPAPVIDAALHIPLPLFRQGALSKIAFDLAERGESALAVAFAAGHLDRPGTLLGSSRMFTQLDEYVPLIGRCGGGHLLWRLFETIMEFGIRVDPAAP